jgi:hypothetical protein
MHDYYAAGEMLRLTRNTLRHEAGVPVPHGAIVERAFVQGTAETRFSPFSRARRRHDGGHAERSSTARRPSRTGSAFHDLRRRVMFARER